MRPSLCASLALLFAAPAGLYAADYVVAPNGSDGAPGTADAPFQTVQKAAQVLKPGDTAYLRAGTYRETVVPSRSGAPGTPVTFRAYPGERPVVSGADPVSGWSSHKGRIYKAPMPWTRNTPERKAGMDQVFVDGVMVPEARWPDIGDVDPSALTRDQLARAERGTIVTAGAKEGDAAVSRYETPALKEFPADAWKGAHIFFLPGALWCGVTGDVTASASGSVTFTYNWLARETFYETRAKDFFFLWGKLEALDSPGEWFRDERGALYLWTPKGDSPASHVVEAKRRDLGFDLRGRAHVAVDGISLFACGIETDERSAGVVLDGIDARYVGHALWYRGWWSLATDIGINLKGPDSALLNSAVAGAAGHAVVLRGAGSRAVNNVICDAGYVTNGCNIAANGEGLLVECNTLRGTGNQTCLDLSRAAGARARHNDISHSGRLIIDEAAIWVARDTDGRGMEIAWNRIHDTHAPADGKDYFGNGGIYLEGRVKNVVLHHNVLWAIAGPGIYLPGVEGEFAGVQVVNNTCDATINALKPGGVTLRNNVFHAYQFDRVPPGDPGGNVTFRKQQGGLPFVKDPGFVNAAAFDFRPRPGSPLIDKGVPVPPWTDGFAGAAPDVGALEAGKPPFPAGAVVAARHLSQLRVAYAGTPTSSTVFTISGLPPDRGLGEDFRLQIGANAPGGEVAVRGGMWTVMKVPWKPGSSSGPVSAVIGDGKPVTLKRAGGGGWGR